MSRISRIFEKIKKWSNTSIIIIDGKRYYGNNVTIKADGTTIIDGVDVTDKYNKKKK